MMDVHRRVIRGMRTGRVIDDCIPDSVPDIALHRKLPRPESIRVELTMEGSEGMFKRKGTDVAEVYSQPRITQEAAMRTYDGTRLIPGWSLDLTMNDPSTGEPWNLAEPNVQARVRKMVVETEPFLIIGSPPCTMFSSLQNLSKHKRSHADWDRRMREAEKHIRFCIELYKLQMKGRRFFLHEHPHAATSWQEPCIQSILAKGC